MGRKVTAQILVILTVIIWSFFGLVTKLLSDVRMDVVMAIALCSSCLFNYIYAYRSERKFPILKSVKLCFVTLFGYSIYWILYIECIKSYTLTSIPVILNYTWPFFTGIFTILLFKLQKISWVFVMTMVLGFAGIILLQSQGQFSNLKFNQSYYGLLMGVACGMSYGFYSAKSSQVHKSDLPSFLFTGSFISSIVMILYVYLTNDMHNLNISLYEVLLAFFVGFFFESIGYLFWTRAQTLAVEEKADITKLVSLANYLPLFSILLLGLIYTEERAIITEGYFLVSILLIVGSSLLPVIIRDKKITSM